MNIGMQLVEVEWIRMFWLHAKIWLKVGMKLQHKSQYTQL